MIKKDKLTFVEAVKQLAGEAGIEVEEQEKNPQAEAEAKEKEELTRLLELAADWFRRIFREGADAEIARAYAAKRGLSDETLEKFQIGYAPGDGGALERAAVKKGYTREQLIKAGLVIQNERGSYCRFRSRLMFPIQDGRGRVVGFGGRILGDGEPKYLNSPETPLFSKSRLLYAMPQAKDALLKKKRALLTEGYMDAIACQQAGIHEAVAVLGTALTEEHAKQLKRYVDQVLLVFDADQAGLRAALRGGEILLKAGLEPRVLRLGEFKDPDEFIKAKGREAFDLELENAGDAVAFFADALLSLAKGSKAGELSLREKAAVVQQLFPLLARYATAMETDVQLRAVAGRLGLDFEAVKDDFERFKASPPSLRQAEPAPSASASGVPAQRKRPDDIQAIEMEILGLLSLHPELLPEAVLEMPEPAFCEGPLQSAASLLWNNPGRTLMELENDGSEAFREGEALLSKLAFSDSDRFPDPAGHLQDLLRMHQWRLLAEKNALIQDQIAQLKPGEDGSALLRKKQELKVAIQHLKHA